MKKVELLFVLIFVLILGCKSDKQTTTETNQVKIHLKSEPKKLSPILATDSYGLRLLNLIFPNLLELHPTELKFVPFLAKSRPVVQDISEGKFEGGMSIQYELREEAKWDDGLPVSGEDVLFSMKMLHNPFINAAIWKSYLGFIEEIELDRDLPGKFTFYTSDKYILAEEVSAISVYPKHVYDSLGLMDSFTFDQLRNSEEADWSDTQAAALRDAGKRFESVYHTRDPKGIVNCGAYEVVEWLPEQRIRLKKKENWWGDKVEGASFLFENYPDQIDYLIVKDDQSALLSLKSRDLDAMSELPTTSFAALKESGELDEFVALEQIPSLIYHYIGFNTKNQILSDKKVRRAFNHLIDMEACIDAAVNGLGVPLSGPIHPSQPYYAKDIPTANLDLTKAEKLLEEAGWIRSDGQEYRSKIVNGQAIPLEIDLLIPANGSVQEAVSLILQQDARKAGIKINLDKVEFSRMRQLLGQRSFDMFALAAATSAGLYDPLQLWHTSSNTTIGGNRTGFGNSDTDALIERIRTTLNEEDRNNLYKEFQEILFEEKPCIFLFAAMQRIAINKRIIDPTLKIEVPGFEVRSFAITDQID